ncbi:hypothetical protein SAMN06265222_11350 [Neorhodopirellula lusitana]|uniref:Uncharacterized protein n=1 Tax=Neorhodopirellula lusitana TaxID=445327 RepID=A0ABY1QG94_9BACT|nr:hypothetical protein SAMN06265222_11350 [Neorhodopirellula lusitana]
MELPRWLAQQTNSRATRLDVPNDSRPRITLRSNTWFATVWRDVIGKGGNSLTRWILGLLERDDQSLHPRPTMTIITMAITLAFPTISGRKS